MTSCTSAGGCPDEVHLGDIGTVFRATINDCSNGTQTPLDVSSATTLELFFKKPSGTVVTQTAVLTTDGTDGQIEYVTISGDLDEVGNWMLQARVVMAGGDWRSDIGQFRVYANL